VGGLCEKGRGRRLEYWIISRPITPVALGLAGAAQIILQIRTVTEKGRTTTTRQYFVTSRPIKRLDPIAFRLLRRLQWGIESSCHQRLDNSLHEDKSRVRSLNGAATLALLSRLSVALFVKDCQRPQPVRDKTYPVWSGRLLKHPRPMLDRLLAPCLPP
jgi:hypothetical protein